MSARVLSYAAAVLLIGQVTTRPEPITVSAATSLTNALEEMGRVYEAAGGGAVRLNFAGSNVLARQIANGAPVDLFISADEAQMDLVEQAGAVLAGTRIDLLGNQLAVVAPQGGTIRDLDALERSDIRRIAVGDPAAVPAGVYARQYLEAKGKWAVLSPKLVPLPSVRAALAAVANGSADAGIVYESDATVSGAVEVGYVIPAAEGPRIVYPAALVRHTARRAEAERFLAFLRGPSATAVFERHKFVPLAARR
jgi:molybdate transport system substrate-binding protein